MCYSSDGSSLYSAVGNRVACFDLVRSRSFTFPFEARRNISRLALSPDGAILLAVDDEGHLLLANVLRRVVVHHLALKQPVADMCFSPDGRWVAFALGRLVQVWETPALERSFTPFALHKTLGGHGDDVSCLAWSSDSLFIASGGKDMTVRVHSVHQLPGYMPGNLSGHRSAVKAVFFGKRELGQPQFIYAVSREGALSVWRLTERYDVNTDKVASDRAQAIVQAGEGRGEQALGCWWELAARHYFDKQHARVSSAVMHLETGLLVVGFNSGVFALYELPECNEIHTLSISENRCGRAGFLTAREGLRSCTRPPLAHPASPHPASPHPAAARPTSLHPTSPQSVAAHPATPQGGHLRRIAKW